jgi:hypothetical protein
MGRGRVLVGGKGTGGEMERDGLGFEFLKNFFLVPTEIPLITCVTPKKLKPGCKLKYSTPTQTQTSI